VPLTDGALAGADCVIIATDHSAIDYRLVADQAPLIVDTRNVLRDRGNSHVVRL
jgi:UDP-N-acetyl-D-glucosamine dehydrogenase